MVLVVAAVASSACASRGAVRELRADIDQLAKTVSTLQAQQMIAPVREEALKADVRTLATQVAATDARVAETREQLARLDARVTAAERAVRDVDGKIDAMQATVAKLEASAPPRPVAPSAPLRESAAPPRGGASPEQTYAAALALFRAREHGQAVLDFLDFLARHPKHALAPAAQYWIGEAYFVQRDYRQAIVEFQKVLEHGLANSKVPDALLRAGMAWQRLRDVARARELWRRVARDYPKSEAAQQARTLLAGAR